MEHGRLNFLPAKIAVIKMAVGILHVGDGPVSDLACQLEFRKESQGIDALRGALNVDRPGPVMEIFRRAVRQEEVALEILKAALKLGIESVVPGGLDISAQAVQVIPRVEAINPMILRSFAVVPGAIRQLARATVEHG